MRISQNLTAPLTFVALLIFADQLTKFIIRSQGGFYICNQNIAWGIKISPFLFWLFWIGITLFLATALCDKKCLPYTRNGIAMQAGMTLILSGAISNLIDRVYLGCVTDFIDLKFWPVFNLADVYITAGVIILLLISVKSRVLT